MSSLTLFTRISSGIKVSFASLCLKNEFSVHLIVKPALAPFVSVFGMEKSQYSRLLGYVMIKNRFPSLHQISPRNNNIFQFVFQRIPQLHNGVLFQCMNIPYNQQPNRSIQKHWNPKFKWLRTKKVIHVDLPNFQENEDELSKEERNRRLKEKGVMPARPWTERPILISSVIYHFALFCVCHLSSLLAAH